MPNTLSTYYEYILKKKKRKVRKTEIIWPWINMFAANYSKIKHTNIKILLYLFEFKFYVFFIKLSIVIHIQDFLISKVKN